MSWMIPLKIVNRLDFLITFKHQLMILFVVHFSLRIFSVREKQVICLETYLGLSNLGWQWFLFPLNSGAGSHHFTNN